MLEFLLQIPERFLQYLAATPFDVLAAQALFVVGAVPIAGVVIWGLIQVWQDYKQGQYAGTLKWTLLAVSVPKDTIQSPKGMENFFTNLAGTKSGLTWNERWLVGKFQPWFSFEIVSIGGNIQYYIRAQTKYRDLIEAALYAQYPEAQVTEVEDYIGFIPEEYPNDEYDVWGSEIVTSKPSIFPIRTYESFEHMGEREGRFKDPLLSLLEGFGKMQPSESMMLQILIMPPEEQDWTKDAEKYINKTYGKDAAAKESGGMLSESIGWIPGAVLEQVTGYTPPAAGELKTDQFAAFNMTPQQIDTVKAVARKAEKFGWATQMRFIYVAKKESFRKGTIASMTKGIFNQYSHLTMNKLSLYGGATPKDDYPWQAWEMPSKQMSLVSRYKRRAFGSVSNPYILNTEELATLWHFPAADARTPVLKNIGARRAEAPLELQFAADDEPDLPNLERVERDTKAALPERKKESTGLVTPRLTAPTAKTLPGPRKEGNIADDSGEIAAEDEVMPKPGKPAPLPPGLDLSNEPIEDDEGPSNLPL